MREMAAAKRVLAAVKEGLSYGNGDAVNPSTRDLHGTVDILTAPAATAAPPPHPHPPPRARRSAQNGSLICASSHSSRNFACTQGWSVSATSRPGLALRISSWMSTRSFPRCGAVMPEASLSSM